MANMIPVTPAPLNEPVFTYGPGSDAKKKLKSALLEVESEVVEIPCIIGGSRISTGNLESVTMPHNHGHRLAKFHCAGASEVSQAINAAADAKREWENTPWHERAAVFLRAAELLSGKWRMKLNAATMLGQSKTCHQAEIDSACELIDFWRINPTFLPELYGQQPTSGPGMWNQMELRALEGFVFALTPFNFTAIAANLPSVPALMGNTVLWKPSEPQTLAAYYSYLILEEAGLPPGVINFLPGLGQEIAPVVLNDSAMAGLHFTGSTSVFRSLWQTIGERLEGYGSYPRIVGETGGKDFILAHPSADARAVLTAIVRGGYEFQGQKCSAASRVYLPESLWQEIGEELRETVQSLTMGDVRDFRNYVGAVIKKDAFERHENAIKRMNNDVGVEILAGGKCDDSKGWFVQPTLTKVDDPGYWSMKEELFGPIVTLHVFPDAGYDEMLRTVDRTSPYALTGAVFANDRSAIVSSKNALRHSAGNFYVNDKPTGAVVAQQPFGGGRASGTNDKAGAAMNLMRWVSARTIKETFAPPTDYRYEFLREE